MGVGRIHLVLISRHDGKVCHMSEIIMSGELVGKRALGLPRVWFIFCLVMVPSGLSHLSGMNDLSLF